MCRGPNTCVVYGPEVGVQVPHDILNNYSILWYGVICVNNDLHSTTWWLSTYSIHISSNEGRGYYYFNVPEGSGHYSRAATIRAAIIILVHTR